MPLLAIAAHVSAAYAYARYTSAGAHKGRRTKVPNAWFHRKAGAGKAPAIEIATDVPPDVLWRAVGREVGLRRLDPPVVGGTQGYSWG